MSQDPKMELPKGWKKLNFYSLHLSYCFIVMVCGLQVPIAIRTITKAFGESVYDLINGWSFILLIVTGSCSGVLGYVRMNKAKRILNVLENDASAGTDKRDGEN